MKAKIVAEIDGFGQQIRAIVIELDQGVTNRAIDDYVVEKHDVRDILMMSQSQLKGLLIRQVSVDKWKRNLQQNKKNLEEQVKGGNTHKKNIEESIKNRVVLILDKGDKNCSTKQMIGTGRDATLAVNYPEIKIICKQEKCVLIAKEVVDEVADTFVVKRYKCANGKELSYNLFIPENYDEKKSYPLVLFIHDSGSCSDDDVAPLAQGNGAVIWATKKEQDKRPCFVVAPRYPEKCAEDDFTVGWEAEATVSLLKDLMNTFSINKNRIYGTGQSMGCMILCELNIRYPQFFGGCFLVAGQWNPNSMVMAKHTNLWILVSEKDEKAFPIMGKCISNIEATGIKVSRKSWSARLPEQEQNDIVHTIAMSNTSINFTWFEGDTVIPAGEKEVFPGSYHMNTWTKAYNIEAIREWLFNQYRTLDFSLKHDVMIQNEDGSLQPMDQPYFEAKEVAPGTWQILSDGDYSYLVEGEDEAIVIDSGYGCGNIREYCQTLTEKPVKNIANTHDHFDHTANNTYFECAYMSKATEPLATIPFKSFSGINFPKDYKTKIVKEGDIISIGKDRCLEVFEIPDHAVGSIAFLDKKEKILFCGDELCMPFGKPLNGSVQRFKEYLLKFEKRRSDIKLLMGGPGICDAALMDQLLENLNYILIGHEGETEQFDIKQENELEKEKKSIIYHRRMPHWPEDMPEHMGKPNPEKRIMDYAGVKVFYNVNKVFE